MAEKETPDGTEDGPMLDDTQLAEQRNAAFAEGTADDEDGKPAAAQAEAPKGDEDGSKGGEKPKDEGTADAATQAEDDDAPVTLTRRELKTMMAAVDEVPRLKTQLESVNGRMGSMKQTVDGFRTGAQVELTDDDFKELKDEFGVELAGASKAVFERVLKKGRGAAAPMSTDEVVARVKYETKMEDLTEAYPDWQSQLGNNPGGAPNLEAPLRKWLDAHPDKAYAESVNKTGDPAVIRRALDRMKAQAEVPKQKPAAPAKPSQTPDVRRQRMAAAATPRTDGGAPTVKQKTRQDYFNDGYTEGA